jgi:prepilin-type processing-associated H-X9-DG protein
MSITKVSAALTNLDGGVVINESSADADFRVESNGNANMLFVDGGNDRVGIGTASPARELHVHKASSGATSTSSSVLVVEDDDNTELSILGGSSSVLAINFGHSGDNDEGIISFNTTSGSENLGLSSSKDITYTTTSTNSTAGHHIFKSYNTEIMRIDGANNRVGIGTTSPTQKLHLHSTGAVDMKFTSDSTGVAGSDGVVFGINSGGSTYLWNYENEYIYFGTNNSEKMRILAGGGITFNGDTAAANALDDYEEGTFTASLENTGTSPKPTAVGAYTKIGRQVVVHIYFNASSSITSAGNTRITGLPFTASNVNGAYGMCFYAHGNIVSDNKGSGYVTSTAIDIIGEGTTGYATWTTGSGKYGMWTAIYQTA